MDTAYTIVITLILSVLIGNLFHDIRTAMLSKRPQVVNAVVTVVLSDNMTFHAAQNICAICGWRLERRGMQLILWQGYNCQHSAVMVAA